jgi:hypothetical protein
MCFNSFTLKKCLGAGGGASGYNGNLGGVTAQTTITLDDGLVAGAGATSGSGASVTAGNATSPGCGGGAAISVAYSNLTPTVTSGAGKDGGVYIYTRMAVV